MGKDSKIEWTDHTFNPWVGCTHKLLADGSDHPACEHCYAEAFTKFTGFAKWGLAGTRVKTSEKYWRQPLAWNAKAAKEGTRPKVFCASYADVFEEWTGPLHSHDGLALTDEDMRLEGFAGHPLEMCREDLFTEIIDKTPHLDWLLLTKRPENIRRMWPAFELGRWDSTGRELPLNHRRPNVWLGTSVSDQPTADAMIPELLACRDLAPVLFLSIEPLLGPIILPRTVAICPHCGQDPNEVGLRSSTDEPFAYYCNRRTCRDSYPLPSIDWVIVGGESGHHARPMHPGWARSIRDQCMHRGVPFFFKQWGEWLPVGQFLPEWGLVRGGTAVGPERMKLHCSARQQGIKHVYAEQGVRFAALADDSLTFRVGKHDAGRLLDGRQWSEYPRCEVPA